MFICQIYFGQFLSVHFPITWESLNLRLTFAICRKRDSRSLLFKSVFVHINILFCLVSSAEYSDTEWKTKLTPDQYWVCRQKGTEPVRPSNNNWLQAQVQDFSLSKKLCLVVSITSPGFFCEHDLKWSLMCGCWKLLPVFCYCIHFKQKLIRTALNRSCNK